MDYYGCRLATCSSDRSVRIYDVKNGTQTLAADLRGHEGPVSSQLVHYFIFRHQLHNFLIFKVWQIAWAHPKFGNLLASCSYDRKVIIWKETNGQWHKYHEYLNHDSSVNSVCWAPHDFGLILACGSSDGSISILSATTGSGWEVKKINNAHTVNIFKITCSFNS
jgi:protein transport protein SEC13